MKTSNWGVEWEDANASPTDFLEWSTLGTCVNPGVKNDRFGFEGWSGSTSAVTISSHPKPNETCQPTVNSEGDSPSYSHQKPEENYQLARNNAYPDQDFTFEPTFEGATHPEETLFPVMSVLDNGCLAASNGSGDQDHQLYVRPV
jgi:hypothetical protein